MMRSIWLQCALLVSLIYPTTRGYADDWPQWGGPQRDLIWRETELVDTLPEQLDQVWSAPIAEGYAGPAVADGRVFVTDRVAEENLERVHAFAADTGQPLWTHSYEASYSISYPAGPRATPTVDEDRVYTIGAVGHLFCLDVASGNMIWKKDFQQDFGTRLPTWGMAGAPLVEGDQLICLVGGADGALVVSFNKHTGEELWRSLDDPDVGYCQPVILEFGGRRQLIIWHATHVSALDPADGKLLWQYPFPTNYALTVPMPRKLGNRLFLTAFYEGPLMLDLGEDGVSPTELWRSTKGNNEIKNDSLHSIMPTTIVTDEYLYGVSSYGQLRCLETETGKLVWETREATGKGRWWNAFLVPHLEMSGQRVYLANEQGELIQAKLDGEGYHELARAQLLEPTRKVQRRMTIWSHPAFAMQSVFARNDKELIRVDLSAK